MSLRDKIAQLVQIRVPGKFLNRRSPDYLRIEEQVRKDHIGGLVLFAGNVYESAILLNELQSISQVPLIVSSDFERGASFRISETTSFPWSMALGAAADESLAYRQGLITAQEARALGVHWIFAPVLDVNNNPDNPVINIRSFGEDPNLVARLGAAFIRGAQKGRVLTTAKHFPGHGDTATDSHIGLPVVSADMARLQALEFIPFKSAIDAGVDSIMTAHVAVPRITGEAKIPATMSSAILTETLRNTLNFKGIVVTDALEMAGISDSYWCGLAAVRALQAGADILLLPPDATIAINEVERAVKNGELSATRIDASVRKILDAKRKLGLPQNRLAPLRPIGEIIASPESIAFAQEIANRAITVIKDDQHVLPINPLIDKRIFSLMLSFDSEANPGASFQNEMSRRFTSLRASWANARTTEEQLPDIDRSIANSDIIVCAMLSRLTTGQKNAPIPEQHQQIIRKILAAQKPVIWAALGNPYLLRIVPQFGTYLCSFSYSDNSQVAAAKAISGEIPVSGRMPVSIPGISSIGAGLQIPRLDLRLKQAQPEELGLAINAFEKTSQLFHSLVEEQTLPGGQLIAGYKGKIALQIAVGKTEFAVDSLPVTSATTFNLSTISRPTAITMAALPAIDSGKLMLDSRVNHYLIELGDSDEGALRIRDLLQSISVQEVAGNSDKAAALLEKILLRITGMPWHELIAQQLLHPMGMNSTLHHFQSKHRRGMAQGTSTDSFTLFSNAEDMAVFAQMLLNRGLYNHYRFAGSKTLAKIIGSEGPWPRFSSTEGALKLSQSTFGCNASNGSFFWVDPARGLFLILLTNGRSEDSRISESQKKLQESILSAIPD
jgi:beta-glucosidase-like glycosyl hydrolase/CubicO group peptidase (beta-lactamase class C family)